MIVACYRRIDRCGRGAAPHHHHEHQCPPCDAHSERPEHLHLVIAGATTVSSSSVFIGGSKLDGGAASGAVCAGVWDESYTFFAGPACP